MSAPVIPDRPSTSDSDRLVVPSEALPPKCPRHFGPYVLLARLARGGMGDVRLAKVGRVADNQRWSVMSPNEAREHTAAVKECALRCHAGAKR